jgi:hypothetical protein
LETLFQSITSSTTGDHSQIVEPPSAKTRPAISVISAQTNNLLEQLFPEPPQPPVQVRGLAKQTHGSSYNSPSSSPDSKTITEIVMPSSTRKNIRPKDDPRHVSVGCDAFIADRDAAMAVAPSSRVLTGGKTNFGGYIPKVVHIIDKSRSLAPADYFSFLRQLKPDYLLAHLCPENLDLLRRAEAEAAAAAAIAEREKREADDLKKRQIAERLRKSRLKHREWDVGTLELLSKKSNLDPNGEFSNKMKYAWENLEIPVTQRVFLATLYARISEKDMKNAADAWEALAAAIETREAALCALRNYQKTRMSPLKYWHLLAHELQADVVFHNKLLSDLHNSTTAVLNSLYAVDYPTRLLIPIVPVSLNGVEYRKKMKYDWRNEFVHTIIDTEK